MDARTLYVKGGSRTYASNLLKNISKKENIVLFGVSEFDGYKCVPEPSNQQNPFFRLYYDYIKLPRLLKKHKMDVFHGLKGVGPKTTKVKTIITVHDLYVLRYPNFASVKDKIYWKYISLRQIKRSDKIIAVSSSTKSDLITFLKIEPEKIKVIYESFNKELYKIRENAKERVINHLEKKSIFIQDTKIILNVNTIQPRKNIVNLIKAFNIIAPHFEDYILIIAGRIGWKTRKIFEEYKKSPFKERIHFIGFAPDEIVADLYNIAKVFVYPSFYEGFGLPILEAQACGCPVVTSNISSMPEVAGDGAELIDPNNAEDIANSVIKILDDKEYRNKLIKKGFENIKRFSWKKCAEDTVKTYEEVMK